MPVQGVRIRDCESVQAEWLRKSAIAAGGKLFGTHGIDWAWNPREAAVYGLFLQAVDGAGLRPALAEAVRLGAKTVGLWMNAAVRAPQALEIGFDIGWQPWWMAAAVLDVPMHHEPVPTHRGLDVPEGAWQAELSLDGDWAASGSLFVPGPENGPEDPAKDRPVSPDRIRPGLAGVFDMEVLESRQRQGLGTRILRALNARAQAEGAEILVLNSTPAGERLYRKHGFELIGRGQTYWLPLA